MSISELDRVVLTKDLPDERLVAGDVGVVVHAYPESAAYEIEVFTLTGETLTVATVAADAVRKVDSRDVVSARSVAAE